MPSRARNLSVNVRATRRTRCGRPRRWPAVARLFLCGFVLLTTTAAAFAQADPRGASSFWSAPWARAAQPAPQIPHPAVARIIVPERDGTSLGSGTLVDVTGDYGLVITNWHVVSDGSGVITVVFPDGFRTAAQLIKVDRTWDLAALAVWKPHATPVPLASTPPRPGEPLTIAGYGSGDYRAAAGRCTQYVAPDSNQPFEMVELDTAARQGDSGGPIFNSRGELAGVLFGAGHGTTSGSYCGRVRGFLESVLPSGDTVADNTSIAQRDSQRPTQLNAMLPRVETTFAGPRTSRPRASLDNSYQHGPNTNQDSIASTGPSPNDSRPNQGTAQESGAAGSPAGTSPLGQTKTFLAVVCGAAFALHLLKLLSPKAKPDAEATDDTGEKTESAKSARRKTK